MFKWNLRVSNEYEYVTKKILYGHDYSMNCIYTILSFDTLILLLSLSYL